MRVGRDLALGELAHLVADGFQRVVEPVIEQRARSQQLDQACSALGGVAGGDQEFELRRHSRRDLRAGDAQIREPDDLALAHRDAAEDLRDVLAEADAHRDRLELAEPPLAAQPLRIGGELAHGLDVGGEPREPVRGALLAIEDAARHLAGWRDQLAHRALGIRQQSFQDRGRLAAHFDEVAGRVRASGGQGHR